jgi:hypothetical protein
MCHDSDYLIVCLEGKDILIEEIERPKMNPEYGVFAYNSTSKEKQLIAKFEYRDYAKVFLLKLTKWMTDRQCFNPMYVQTLNCNPAKNFFM